MRNPAVAIARRLLLATSVLCFSLFLFLCIRSHHTVPGPTSPLVITSHPDAGPTFPLTITSHPASSPTFPLMISPSSTDHHRPPRPIKKVRRPAVLPNALRAPSSDFSRLAHDFLHDPLRPCKPRFFMTRISPRRPLTTREHLSIESVFRSHPDACLLILTDAPHDSSLDKFRDKGFRIASLRPDLRYLLKNTPGEQWLKKLRSKKVPHARIPLGQNLSNLIRLAALYKYGGVYIDTDVIVTKSFAGLRNAIGAQSADAEGNWTRLNNAIMVFDKMHPLLYEFIEEFAMHYNGNKWGHNGPYLVSRVVRRIEGQPGYDYTVLPPWAFYPVDWRGIRWLMKGTDGGTGMGSSWVSRRHMRIREDSYAVHLWNKQSRHLKVEGGSVIGRIMMESCIFCDSTRTAMEAASA